MKVLKGRKRKSIELNKVKRYNKGSKTNDEIEKFTLRDIHNNKKDTLYVCIQCDEIFRL